MTLYDECQMRTCPQLSSLSVLTPALALAALLATALAGCRSLPPSKPESQWSPVEARGAQLFQRKCARCHYPTTTSPLHGPGLQALTKLNAMPSGAPPNDTRITAVIVHGRQMMPATALDESQLHDLLAYLHTL
jgi:mono/diheme cytochrome c family protein